MDSLYSIRGAVQKDMYFHFFLLTAAIVVAGLPFVRYGVR